MATIGSVAITVYVRDKDLKKSLLKAERSIRNFANKSARTLKRLGKTISVGLVAGIAAVTYEISKYAKKIR